MCRDRAVGKDRWGMATEPLKVAVIGCGHFGEVHAATYAEFDRAELVMVCDADADRAKRVAEKFGCRHCVSAEEVAADPDIQAVSIATPDFAHRDASVAVARAGKHVLIEKPLATTLPDAQAIVDAVSEAGVVGMVDFHNRCHPALTTVKDRLDRGEIGRPQMMYARLSDRLEVATEWFGWSGLSGPEWFLGSHLVDIACWIIPIRNWLPRYRDSVDDRRIREPPRGRAGARGPMGTCAGASENTCRPRSERSRSGTCRRPCPGI